jgi:hypothetical protein
MTEDQGASASKFFVADTTRLEQSLSNSPLDELVLSLCRNDQEEDLEKLLDEGQVDLSFVDGAGNSAAHYA